MPTKKELEQQVQEYRNEIGRLCEKNHQLTKRVADLNTMKEFLSAELEAADRAKIMAEFDAARVPELEALAELRRDQIIQLRSDLAMCEAVRTASADFFQDLGNLMGGMRRQIQSSREKGAA